MPEPPADTRHLLSRGARPGETAPALFVRPVTVEYHLRHVHLKLGIRSRAALADVIDG
jgi:DNA-binding CsgD family transcriptional regulator